MRSLALASALALSLAVQVLVAGRALAAAAVVTVGHNRIEPTKVTIKAGDSVTFHNVDLMPGGHTIKADDGSFASPPLGKDEDYTHEFEKSGTVGIHIEQHPAAKGTIVVE